MITRPPSIDTRIDNIAPDFYWAESHIDVCAEVCRKFGSKPNRTPCSVAALRKSLLEV